MTNKRNILKGAIISLALLSGCDYNLNENCYEENIEERGANDTETGLEVREQPLEAIPAYPNFRFQDELNTIRFHAGRVGADERLMLAIREAENGRAGRQFGVMPNERYDADNGYTENGQFHRYPDDGDLSRQASWAAWTIRRNRERFERNNEGHENFIDYLSERYAPRGADNDPNNLNENWARNVRNRYDMHSR